MGNPAEPRGAEAHRQHDEDDPHDQDDEPRRGDRAVQPAELRERVAPDRNPQDVVEPGADRDAGAAREDEQDPRVEQEPLPPAGLPRPRLLRVDLERGGLEDLPALRALRRVLGDGGAAAWALVDFDGHRRGRGSDAGRGL